MHLTIKNGVKLFEILNKVVDQVREAIVMQVIIDNRSNFVGEGSF